MTWGVGSIILVPPCIGTYSACTGGLVLIKICCDGVDSSEVSTGVGGGASGGVVICCSSTLVYVAILQPKKKFSSTLCTRGVKYQP